MQTVSLRLLQVLFGFLPLLALSCGEEGEQLSPTETATSSPTRSERAITEPTDSTPTSSATVPSTPLVSTPIDPSPPAELLALLEAETRLYRLLPTTTDLPNGFTQVSDYHSVGGVCVPSCPGGRLGNGRVQFELESAAANPNEISCAEFFISEFDSETAASEGLAAVVQAYGSLSNQDQEQVEVLVPEDIGSERSGQLLISHAFEIGGCGTRTVFAYQAVRFRTTSLVIEIIGYSEALGPAPDLVHELARMQLARIESATEP